MVNGFDKNWARVLWTIEGFRARYSRWPTRLRVFPQILEDLRSSVFSQQTFSLLQEKMKLVPGDKAPMVAADEDGNTYRYEGVPQQRSGESAQDWLGVVPDGPGKGKRW